jgi:hypothetical protein
MSKRAGIIEKYLKDIGTATEREIKFSLATFLFKRYGGELEPASAEIVEIFGELALPNSDECYAYAAGVTNRVFGEQLTTPFQTQHVIEITERAKHLSTNERLSSLITGAAFNICYARYAVAGGKHGIFSNNYLAYIRTIGRSPGSDVSFALFKKITYLHPDILNPLTALLELGIFRPLPRNPNSKELFNAVHEFALKVGTVSES